MSTSQVPPSIDELRRAKPHVGTGAPARCASHKSAILDLLRSRGPQGVLSSELYNCPESFGRSPRNRISELRAEGSLIAGEPRGISDWHYVLLHDSAGVRPLADSPDWYQRQTGKPRIQEYASNAGPLFPEAA